MKTKLFTNYTYKLKVYYTINNTGNELRLYINTDINSCLHFSFYLFHHGWSYDQYIDCYKITTNKTAIETVRKICCDKAAGVLVNIQVYISSNYLDIDIVELYKETKKGDIKITENTDCLKQILQRTSCFTCKTENDAIIVCRSLLNNLAFKKDSADSKKYGFPVYYPITWKGKNRPYITQLESKMYVVRFPDNTTKIVEYVISDEFDEDEHEKLFM